MPRVTPLSRADAPEEIAGYYDKTFGPGRDPVSEPGTVSGTPGDWWTVWGNVPGILKAFSAYPMAEAPLDPHLRELAILRTGYCRGSQFVFSQHCKSARRVGVADVKIEDVPYWSISSAYSEAERVVLAYVDALMLQDGRVHERLFEALKRILPEDHILMLTYFVNMYSLHAVSTKALRLEYDNVPERVVEIPAPEAPGVQDWRNPRWAERRERR